MSGLTKKDYNRIANALKALPDPAAKRDVAMAVAKALIGSNVRFDPFRFVNEVMRRDNDVKLEVVQKL